MDKESFERVIEVAKTSFVNTVDVHQRLESTNDRALELAERNDLATPALVVAREQSQGRGRGQNSWWSAEGSLTLSLVFALAEEGIPAVHLPRVGLTTAVAICDTLDTACAGAGEAPRVAIKWPNDVLVGGRKVAGILVEVPRASDLRSARVVVGIGVNLNNRLAGAPKDVRQRATSLQDAMGRSVDAPRIVADLLAALRLRWRQLATDEVRLARDWSERCALRGLHVKVAMGNTNVDGLCHGIAPDGALLILEASGDPPRRVYSGHVADVR